MPAAPDQCPARRKQEDGYDPVCVVRSYMAVSGLPVSIAPPMPVVLNSTLVKLSVTVSLGRSPPLLTDQPLVSVLVSVSWRYGSGWLVSVLQKSILTVLPSAPGPRPSEARIRLAEALSLSLLTTTSLTEGVEPSRSDALLEALLIPRPTPHWKLFT